MLYVKVSKKCVAEVVSLPRRPILCRRDDQNAADVSKIFRRRIQGFLRRVQNILPTRPRISPMRQKYFADASKDFADASKIFRPRVQGFRRRVRRFHRRRGNAADATSYQVVNWNIGNFPETTQNLSISFVLNALMALVYIS